MGEQTKGELAEPLEMKLRESEPMPLAFHPHEGVELFRITPEGAFVFADGVEVEEAAREFARWFNEEMGHLLTPKAEPGEKGAARIGLSICRKHGAIYNDEVRFGIHSEGGESMTTAAKIEAAMAVGLAEYEKAIQFDAAKGANSIADSVGTLACALKIVRDNGGSGGDSSDAMARWEAAMTKWEATPAGPPTFPPPDEEEHEG